MNSIMKSNPEQFYPMIRFMKTLLNKGLLILLFLSCLGSTTYAQDTTTSDGLYQEARKAAFDRNDYATAKVYLNKGLSLSPNYADLRIFLGRIYTWTKNYDSARICFKRVLQTSPDYEDVYIAYSDLEYFNDRYDTALEICRTGIKMNPLSQELILREAKILNAQKKYEDADRVVQKLLLLHPKNTDAIALSKTIQENKNPLKADSVIEIPVPLNLPNNDSLTAEGLFMMARDAAFEQKNYELAKNRLYRALHLSPDYADIRVFLGRIHGWEKDYDSARYHFNKVLSKSPSYEDAASALADIEYWNDRYPEGLKVVDSTLSFHPESVDLLIKKAKFQNAMRNYGQAQFTIEKVLRIDKNNTDARVLESRILEASTKNKIGISYEYAGFDKQFSDPWHLLSVDYTRTTAIGSVTGRINYANKFKDGGLQFEVEAYPHISKTFYSYVSVGYSDNVGVFPKWRAGFSLYANLPKSFEGEIGMRYLVFSGDPTYIYTAYLGKYYKSWLFSGRIYVTPSDFTSTASTSYTINAGYYYGSSDDLIRGSFGYGISPDDRLNANQLDNSIRLTSYKAGITYKKKVSALNVLTVDLNWANQEYLPGTKGNQYQFGIGWLHRF